MSLNQFMKRKWASTRAILGDIFQENVEKTPSPPKPLRHLNDYTEERLKEGLAFADEALRNKKRKISPIATHLLTMYKNMVKDALEQGTVEEERDTIIKTVAVFERDIYNQRFLRGPPSTDDSSFLVQRLAQLRRYEFAARYGDYMQYVCEKLKTKAQAEKTQYFEHLQGWNRYWTDIAKDIQSEEEAWEAKKRREPGIQDEHIKTTLAVRNAAGHMGLNFDHAINSIKMYAERNDLVHASIFHFVNKGQWHTLAKLLHRDIMELPTVIPQSDRHNIPVLHACIQELIDQYFIYDDKYPYAYESWSPKPEAIKIAQEMQAKETQRAENLTKERKRLEEAAAKKFKKDVANHSMIHLVTSLAGMPPPSGAIEVPKGSAAERSARKQAYDIQKKAWDQLVKLQEGACKRAHQYQDMYGNMEAPVDSDYWLTLPDDETSRPGSSSSKKA